MSHPVFLCTWDRKLVQFLLSNPQPPMPAGNDSHLARYRWCRNTIKVTCGQDLLPSYWPVIPGAEVR